MAGTIVADTLTHSTAGSIATNYVVEGSVKSWINQQNDAVQNNTNDSFNVASNVDNGLGDNTFTVTNSFSSASFVCNTAFGNSVQTDRFSATQTQANGQQTSSSSYRSYAWDVGTASSTNVDGFQVICIGDLA